MPPETKIPNNAEIDKALREFEAQSAGQPTPKAPEVATVSNLPKMETSGISFETDSERAANREFEVPLPKMVRLVIKWSGGAIKDQRQAEYLLLGVVLLNIILTAIVIFK